ncbi:uncharacterized protein LOC121529225 [Cheilinus undulatus]|uniref:uncharacterized protein LOC121529225 n=1 Tax=Cheilinus undulatus TaxID=241271 RepID=UPI001BD29F4C|nr:uncharacterized protein LOC121529225 [Cheilinus undulatus]XP_041672927.1 uncharacterized protein LOC121529225 [Cheilinus undulatus]
MMMTTMRGTVSWCSVALLFAPTAVSAVKRLESINDLKKIDFGQSVPTHSLVLLYWFAHTVNIDNTDAIQLTFDPNNGEYGSHYYSNFEGLLDPPPPGHRYYTVGNIYQDTPVRLPSYVINPRRQYRTGNRDRIIIRVRGWRIDQVYLTQHYGNSNSHGTPWYDPHHTYHITTDLLRQIREFSVGGHHHTLEHLRERFGSNADVSNIRNIWKDLACLGLLLFIVIQERHITNQHRQNNPDADVLLARLLLLFLLFVWMMNFISQKENRKRTNE